MRFRGLLLLLGVTAMLVVGFLLVALNGECGGGAGCVATARVDGRVYLTSIARSLVVGESDLVRYAAVTRHTDGLVTRDEDAYRLGDIDPTKVLVMKLSPGQQDGAGPIGDYLLLVSDAAAWSLTCPFFPTKDDTRPLVCTQ